MGLSDPPGGFGVPSTNLSGGCNLLLDGYDLLAKKGQTWQSRDKIVGNHERSLY
jgi:hypothetical protein